jgi:ATP-dependent exoDNAse (exonuclease V) beta subunit
VIDAITGAGRRLEVLSRSWRSTPELVAYINHLFVPAFRPELGPEQVALQPTRDSLGEETAVETWRLEGRNKADRALALAAGIRDLLTADQRVTDREDQQLRPVAPGDIAVLCRTHDNLDAVAAALAAMRIPLRYQRPGLLTTPEGCLAMACLRRLLDPRDSLASAEIHTLTTCAGPEAWLAERIEQLQGPDADNRQWSVSGAETGQAAFSTARERLPFITPVETLELAISTGRVRETVKRWGPTDQRRRQRLNNLAALLNHAREYEQQCAAQNQPATGAGLALWLYELGSAATDLQADSGNDAAVQLVTHHGAKGLEWPIVIAMDLDARLQPRLWGLSVLPSPEPVDLDQPLQGRRLRYWPPFSGRHTSGVPLLEKVAASPAGARATARETEEARRLLYVSLTRARDVLVLALPDKTAGGEWMDTLSAPWMLPEGDALALPDGPVIPSRSLTLSGGSPAGPGRAYHPWSLARTEVPGSHIAARLSPSACPPRPGATTGEVIRLGEPLSLKGQYDPGRLGAALHAVIAAELYGQGDHQRILEDYGVTEVITANAARQCATRLVGKLGERFDALRYYCECPIQYRSREGQLIQGWADLLLETPDGFVLIDHKTSPQPAESWCDIAPNYSGQLAAYAEGVRRATDRPITSCWIHFAVGGGLVEVC